MVFTCRKRWLLYQRSPSRTTIKSPWPLILRRLLNRGGNRPAQLLLSLARIPYFSFFLDISPSTSAAVKSKCKAVQLLLLRRSFIESVPIVKRYDCWCNLINIFYYIFFLFACPLLLIFNDCSLLRFLNRGVSGEVLVVSVLLVIPFPCWKEGETNKLFSHPNRLAVIPPLPVPTSPGKSKRRLEPTIIKKHPERIHSHLRLLFRQSHGAPVPSVRIVRRRTFCPHGNYFQDFINAALY